MSHATSFLVSTKFLVSLSQLLRISSVALTYYAVFVLKTGTEGNIFSNVLGYGLVQFSLFGSVIFVVCSLCAVKFYTGRVRLELLLVICLLVALDFINDFAAVFLRVQVLPV